MTADVQQHLYVAGDRASILLTVQADDISRSEALALADRVIAAVREERPVPVCTELVEEREYLRALAQAREGETPSLKKPQWTHEEVDAIRDSPGAAQAVRDYRRAIGEQRTDLAVKAKWKELRRIARQAAPEVLPGSAIPFIPGVRVRHRLYPDRGVGAVSKILDAGERIVYWPKLSSTTICSISDLAEAV